VNGQITYKEGVIIPIVSAMDHGLQNQRTAELVSSTLAVLQSTIQPSNSAVNSSLPLCS
jgi:hypothetical protein